MYDDPIIFFQCCGVRKPIIGCGPDSLCYLIQTAHTIEDLLKRSNCLCWLLLNLVFLYVQKSKMMSIFTVLLLNRSVAKANTCSAVSDISGSNPNKHGIRKSDYLIPTFITCRAVLSWSVQLTS